MAVNYVLNSTPRASNMRSVVPFNYLAIFTAKNALCLKNLDFSMIFVEIECGRTSGTSNEISAKARKRLFLRLLVTAKITLKKSLGKRLPRGFYFNNVWEG